MIEAGGGTPLTVAKGGTGAVTLAGVLKGNGTGAVTGAATAADVGAIANTGWVSPPGAWSYASATTITVPSGAASKYSPGMRVKLTQTTVKYFLVTAVADTILTVYGGTDYTLANAAISAISYSTVKAPLGFPMDPIKWTFSITADTTNRGRATPTAATWYELDSLSDGTGTKTATITPPIGAWKLGFEVVLYAISAAAQTIADVSVALSTANNAASDAELQGRVYSKGASGTIAILGTVSRNKNIVSNGATTYYLIAKTDTANQANIYFLNSSNGSLVIRAVSNYL